MVQPGRLTSMEIDCGSLGPIDIDIRRIGIMLSYEDARLIAVQYIAVKEADATYGIELVLDESHVADVGYGWVFYYNSDQYLRTGNISYALAGNAPFLVRKDNGVVHEFWSGESLETQLREYEEKYRLGSDAR